MILKRKVNYKKSELPQFCDELREVIDEQEHELKSAVINKRKYQFGVQHGNMEITENHWFLNMSISQRESHIKKVLTLQVGSKTAAPRLSVAFQRSLPVVDSCFHSPNYVLSVDVSQFCDSVLIPQSVLDAIWKKGN